MQAPRHTSHVDFLCRLRQRLAAVIAALACAALFQATAVRAQKPVLGQQAPAVFPSGTAGPIATRAPSSTSARVDQVGNASPDEAAALAHELASVIDIDEAGSLTPSATTNDAGPLGIVPLVKGFNASLGYAPQHDSASGWSGMLTPNLAYRFTRHLSVNAGIPVFTRVNTYDVIGTKKATKTTPEQYTYGFARHDFQLGDFAAQGTYEAHPAFFDYTLSATLGVPTGNDALGLGAGQPTYSLNNHFERSVAWFTPELELGVGNTLNLDNTRIRKTYFTVGQSAHLQVGATIGLPLHVTFSSGAFEDLPLSTQAVTTTTSNGKKGAQLKTITTTSEKSIGEDNGFLNTLDIPVSGHVVLSGFYNRSLRNKIDTAGFSLTWLLRSVPHGREQAE